MQSIGKIGYRWHEDTVERYLYLRPLETPSEGDWIEAVKRILGGYQFDSIFMIIDIVDFAPVLTKASFDEMIKPLQERGLRKSTVALVSDDQSIEKLGRMFEASSSGYGFELSMRAFEAPADAVRWLKEQMAGD
mgnify:CR=1 FL=1